MVKTLYARMHALVYTQTIRAVSALFAFGGPRVGDGVRL